MLAQMNIERQPVIQRGRLTIDPQCCTASLDGEEISLYPKEFDVLLLLVQYSGWVLSAKQIYEATWQEDSVKCNTIIYNTICQIRKKLKKPEIIKTVVGKGYKFIG